MNLDASIHHVHYVPVIELGWRTTPSVAGLFRIEDKTSNYNSFDTISSTSFEVPFFVPIDTSAILGRTLIDNAWIRAFAAERSGTAPPQTMCLHWLREEPPHSPMALRTVRPAGQSTAKALLEDVQTLSALTLEEIAPLVGVSRRSLQHWRADEPISARKEQRLRNLVDTLQALKSRDAKEVRSQLLKRPENGLRPYDLLAEGRFDIAFTAMTGRVAPPDIVARVRASVVPTAPALLARISIRDDGPSGIGGKVDLRRSRRSKR